ncbi:glycoside hydrolase domain-containing protein [Brachybacterium equifaecis]|uniref:glycoside hydrolase domain-containing protein n=1 Tax=Brachybacterium equifaecis TaxID=2910770 RepID=UPI0024BEA56B|nr:glycoside hydrolase domain-containing protein [Brachybacterium equifaecis]
MILTPADGSHGSGPRGAATEPHGARPVRFDAPADAPSAAEIPYARLEDHPRLHRIAQGDVLRWMIRPERGSAADRTFAATHAAVDLELSDGTRLSDRDPLDQYGMRATARGQGEGRHLQLDQWNDVQVDLSHLEGLTIVGVLLVTDPPVPGGADADGGPEGERLRGWIEPPRVGPALALPHLDDPVAWVDTRRGAAGAPGLSRGSTAPVAALPNGFAHVLPLTDARDRATPYRHARAQAAEGGALPPLQGIALAHQPGARPDSGQQFTLMPLVTRRPHGGPRERALGFDHAQEVARPDVYSVRTAQGTALHAAPTEHGMLLEIVFAPGSEGRHLLLEGADSRSRFDLAGALFDGAFTAWADGEAPHPGGGPARRLFAAGTVEPLPSHVEDAVSDGDPGLLGTARVMTFPPGTRRVTVRIAASAIGLEQARRTLAQQLLGRTFAEVRRAAHAAWVPRLEVIRSDSASPAQRRTLLGSLYRMNLHPRALHENAGTRQRPLLQHASVRAVPRAEATSSRTAAPLLPGPAYADLSAPGSAGTLWPAYSLLYPALAGPMLEAIAAQAVDPEPAAEEADAPAEVAGVLAAEGALGALAALADAHARGVPLADPLGAAERAVERLTAVPAAARRGEEEPVDCAALRGWTDARVPGSVGLDLARSVADDAIAQMVERALAALPKDALGDDSRALAEQAAYLRSRAARYALHFDADLGLLRARTRDGGFAEDLEDVNPFA